MRIFLVRDFECGCHEASPTSEIGILVFLLHRKQPIFLRSNTHFFRGILMQSLPPKKPDNSEKPDPAVSKKSGLARGYTTGMNIVLGLLFLYLLVVFTNRTIVEFFPPDPVSDRIVGMNSIDAGLATSDTLSMVVPVTYFDGKIDLLFAGAPECSHCQNFVKNDFDDLVEYAQENNLDLAYMPVALSGLGVSISAVENCALETSTIQPRDVVKLGYASVEDIETAAKTAARMVKSEASSEAADAVLMEAFASLHKKISASTEFDKACYEDVADLAGARMGSFSETFGLTATPSFYFSDPKGEVLRSVGTPDYLTTKTADNDGAWTLDWIVDLMAGRWEKI
jgi:thioredoxin-related protein